MKTARIFSAWLTSISQRFKVRVHDIFHQQHSLILSIFSRPKVHLVNIHDIVYTFFCELLLHDQAHPTPIRTKESVCLLLWLRFTCYYSIDLHNLAKYSREINFYTCWNGHLNKLSENCVSGCNKSRCTMVFIFNARTRVIYEKIFIVELNRISKSNHYCQERDKLTSSIFYYMCLKLW